MAKNNPTEVVLRLSDSQVKILAEAAKMGIPEMIVRLTAITSMTKFSMFLIGRLMPAKGQPEIYLTQNINGQNIDPKTVAEHTKNLIRKGVDAAANSAAGTVVQGDVVEEQEEKSGPSGELPDVGLQIPKQPEGNGE